VSKKVPHSTILDIYERKIRVGKAPEVLTAIRKDLIKFRTNRPLLLPLAQLARRAGDATLSIQLLRPLVRPTGRHIGKASPKEQAEYAAALIALGVLPEARRLLRSISQEEAPEALLFTAFQLFAQWNYRDAIPVLESYISSPTLSDYQRLLGQVNLAAALVSNRESKKASEMLVPLRRQTAKQELWLLLGNVLELSAQNEIFAKRWNRATSFLSEASKVLLSRGTVDNLYIRKWQTIVELHQRPGLRSTALKLNKIKQEAALKGSWETSRECDLFLAVATRNEVLRDKVFFGTPYSHYRSRLQSLYGEFDLPSHYDWSTDNSNVKDILNISDFASLRKLGLKPYHLLTKLTMALSADFYKPCTVSGFHSLLYPDDHFDPISSSMRIYQVVRRFRAWAIKHRLPIQLVENKSTYQLIAKPGFAIRVPSDLTKRLQHSIDEKLLAIFCGNTFSLAEAKGALNLPERTLSRELNALVESNVLIRYNRARATRYQFRTQ
jgi:hypothetical protein